MPNYQHMYYFLFLSVTRALKKLPHEESTISARSILESAIQLAEEHDLWEQQQKKRNVWLQALALLLLCLLAAMAFLAGLFYAAIVHP